MLLAAPRFLLFEFSCLARPSCFLGGLGRLLSSSEKWTVKVLNEFANLIFPNEKETFLSQDSCVFF